ncbi:MAG: radical SAM protein [Clostridiales bacterium]|nr:radical SAM protein [Clostridiales bacterium]
MQVGKILYPVSTLGPGIRAGIWVIGCNRNCEGCANPELQTADASKDIGVDKIVSLISTFSCEGVTVSGGEPFLQAAELKQLIEQLRNIGIEDILVYSGFTLRELASMGDPDVDWVLSNITVLIDGPFINSLVDDIPLRGSSNQKVWLFDKRYEQKYVDCLSREKKVDIFHIDDEIHFIGIPFKDYKKLYAKYIKSR